MTVSFSFSLSNSFCHASVARKLTPSLDRYNPLETRRRKRTRNHCLRERKEERKGKSWRKERRRGPTKAGQRFEYVDRREKRRFHGSVSPPNVLGLIRAGKGLKLRGGSRERISIRGKDGTGGGFDSWLLHATIAGEFENRPSVYATSSAFGIQSRARDGIVEPWRKSSANSFPLRVFVKK